MGIFLGEDYSLVSKNALYRCLGGGGQGASPHTTCVYYQTTCGKRWNRSYRRQLSSSAVLLDQQPTSVGSAGYENDKRRHGYAATSAATCAVVIALIVTPEGFRGRMKSLSGNTRGQHYVA